LEGKKVATNARMNSHRLFVLGNQFFIRAFVANFFIRIVGQKKVATNARMNSHRLFVLGNQFFIRAFVANFFIRIAG